MAAVQIDINHLAKLARITLTESEKERFASQLGDVLSHIAELTEVDVTGIEPTAHASPVYNVWSEDVAQPGLSTAEALQNAPALKYNMIVVPKVVD
jgi:aspartyl-tRNA(Asn)/glutamyl-tRNA(Gln) amidotransferase subunit C